MGSKSYQRCLDSLNGHAGQALLLFLTGKAVIEGTNTHKDISAASVRSLRGKKTNDTQVVVRKWQHRHLKHAPILCKVAPSVYRQTHVTCLHFVQPKGIAKRCKRHPSSRQVPAFVSTAKPSKRTVRSGSHARRAPELTGRCWPLRFSPFCWCCWRLPRVVTASRPARPSASIRSLCLSPLTGGSNGFVGQTPPA